MKNLFYLFIALVIFVCSACSNKETEIAKTQTDETKQVQQVKTFDSVHIGSDLAKNNLKEILNNGYKLQGEVYYTKSKDFNNAYFIGANINKNGQIYNCIWFSNNSDFIGDVNSANDYAVESSSLPDARNFANPISNYDDGYSRINQKLLENFKIN